MLKISTGTDIDGKATSISKRSLKYQAGHEGYCRFTAIFSEGIANSRQYGGLIDDLNGFAIGVEGAKFAVYRRRNGVFEDVVTQDHFNVDTINGLGDSEFELDYTKGNIYRVSFGYLGFADVNFEVMTDNGWILFHRIKYLNRHTETHITLPYLKVSATVENFGNDTDISAYVGSVDAGIISNKEAKSSTRNFAFANSYETDADVNNYIAVFHNKTTFDGVENRIETLLSIVSAASEGTKTISIKRYRLATVPTGGTWTDISSDSVMEISEDSTVDLTGAELTTSFSLGKTGQFYQVVEPIELRMLPDDYICYVVTSGGASEIELGVVWKELF